MAKSSSTTTLPDWSPRPPQWSHEELDLLPTTAVAPPDTSIATFIAKSDAFPVDFPIDTNRCKTLENFLREDILERNINSAYPILHENVLHLYARYILYKRRNGNPVEKAVFKEMNVLQLVDRLLTKRAVYFYGKNDLFKILSGAKGSNKWESIGTSSEKAPLILKDCISYEEIKLSAFLSVSSYTHFMNVGDRKNMGKLPQHRSNLQDEGVIMGVIGARLVKKGAMEYQEMVVDETQNSKEMGYGKSDRATMVRVMGDFYEEELPEYGQVKAAGRYTDLGDGDFFDKFIYHKRLTFSIDTLFLEANRRACERNTLAFVHVVGIGLGVWKKSKSQNQVFMDSCGQRIKKLGRFLHNVSDICFSYIANDIRCLSYKNGDVIPIEGHPRKGIKIHICKREPHSRLAEDRLLVVSYAWDGNALPGNEYWNKKLGSTGDSAAASSTQISELHNPYINPKVCSGNLRVVAAGGVVGVQEYAQMARKRKVGED